MGIALSVWFGVAGASAGLVYVVRRRLVVDDTRNGMVR